VARRNLRSFFRGQCRSRLLFDPAERISKSHWTLDIRPGSGVSYSRTPGKWKKSWSLAITWRETGNTIRRKEGIPLLDPVREGFWRQLARTLWRWKFFKECWHEDVAVADLYLNSNKRLRRDSRFGRNKRLKNGLKDSRGQGMKCIEFT